jgi:hypothetical protein
LDDAAQGAAKETGEVRRRQPSLAVAGIEAVEEDVIHDGIARPGRARRARAERCAGLSGALDEFQERARHRRQRALAPVHEVPVAPDRKTIPSPWSRSPAKPSRDSA